MIFPAFAPEWFRNVARNDSETTPHYARGRRELVNQDKQHHQTTKGAFTMSIIYDTTDTNSVLQLAWPPPATGLPKFRISWAEWANMLAGASSSRPSQTPERPSRAA
jgi:hypothetical protein